MVNRNDKQNCKGARETPGETLLLAYLGYMETTTTTTELLLGRKADPNLQDMVTRGEGLGGGAYGGRR